MSTNGFSATLSARRATLWSCGIVGGLLLSAVVAVVAQPLSGELPPAPVRVARVVQRQINAGQTFVGTVVPLRTSMVGSSVEGHVTEFLVNEGDHVQAGQRLAQLRIHSLELELPASQAE